MKLRYIFLAVEIVIMMFFLLPVFSNILNPGNIAGMFISAVLILITVFWNKFKELCENMFKHTGGKIVIISVSVIVAAGIIYAAVLTGLMINACVKSPENSQAVVVLGCKVKGDSPSRMLRRRLDAAAEFLSEHEDVFCIVSGGKGDDEQISEAQAMQTYLVQKGISEERIIMEDQSVSTYENLENSCRILKEMGITGDIAIVTDGFHQYRAGFIADRFGYDTSAINSVTDFYNATMTPTYYVREWMAITNEYLKCLKR
ncbi:YdcF family protein [Porcipelethomonas sp.]|uniref:YdcF family protein n=1 Tax=Porcipelethomonas sp. TaxID=2981675 RepID=UPI003EF81FC3